MNLLLDTHALIWFLEDDARLGRRARAAIADPGIPLVMNLNRASIVAEPSAVLL